MHYIWYKKDLEKVKKNGYKVFSTFSCGGGSCMGYKLAGYEIIGDCEIDKKINDVYLKNFNIKYNYNIPIQELVNYKDFPKELYNIDLLDGSPPCSTFSLNGEREKNWGKGKKFREGQAEQILDDLFFDYIKLVDILKPKIAVAENVKGIILGKAKGYVNLIIKQLNAIGYNVQIFLLNSATMGVPQRRERVFFICTRKDLNLPKIDLKFNEKPILYGEFADTDYKPFNKDTLEYKRWLKRKDTDLSIGDIVARTENGKVSCFSHKFIRKNNVPLTLTAGDPFIRFDKPRNNKR